MRKIFLFVFLLNLLLCSCDVKQREQELQRKRDSLNQKEQELLVKEQTLQLKEDELDRREKKLDSAEKNILNDTVFKHPEILGSWTAKMSCVETNCAGSAVGDTKTETWQIEAQSNNAIVKAFANENLSRVYVGSFSGDTLRLSVAKDSGTVTQASINVALIKTGDNRMEGKRQIVRQDCFLTYAVGLTR